MKISRTSVALGAIAVVLTAAAGLPAAGQDAPESLLPPGFGESTAPEPPPTPSPAPRPTPAATPTPLTTTPDSDEAEGEDSDEADAPDAKPTQSVAEMLRYELPPSAKRSLERVGFVAPSNGFAADSFGRSDGRFLEALMRRTSAPLPSRWLSIGLRRALSVAAHTPRRVNGADWAAERAWLLLRMGEANAARAVVDSVDVGNYTPKLFQVAMQASLATGDPAGMCPLVAPARAVSRERSWVLADAMCTALGGEPKKAGEMIDAERRRNVGRRIDVALAEKVVGRGLQGQRDVTVEWGPIDRLTAWRYGLAIATGVEIPEELLDEAGAQVRYWRALSPNLTPGTRVPAAEAAAAQGVFSSAALVDLYGIVDADPEDAGDAVGTARDLRSAYVDTATSDRIAMLRRLWAVPSTERGRFARSVLTAHAAARIAPGKEQADAADALIASMLTAGLDLAALRWAPYVERGSEGWALLALSDPDRAGPFDGGDIRAYDARAATGDRRKTQMLFAGLAGLGRIREGDISDIARDFDVAIGTDNGWTRAIDQAGERGEAGTVMVLAAIGMQTADWRGVPPEALFHIVAALRAAGLEGYARMIAAEAVARV